MTAHPQLRLRPLMPQLNLASISAAGLLSTVLIAVGSYGAGALPANDPTRKVPLLGLLRHGAAGLHTALALYYAGLFLFVITWLLLGRLLLTARPDGNTKSTAEVIESRQLRRIFTRWMLPLLVGMPLASMDLYSYAAQAQLAQHGFNPYTATPADLPGKFLDNVAWSWVDTPSPYGPLWVAVSRFAAQLTGNHALISVLLLRLLPFAALLVVAALLPELARRFGVRADLALWLTVANPLMLLHGVGGGHNDVVMVVFVIGALSLATRPRHRTVDLAGAAVLGALAGAVKSPGLVALAFVVPLWLMGRNDVRLRTWVRACALVCLVVVCVFGAVSLVAGVGLGWTKQVNTSARVFTFLSLPTMAAVLYRALTGASNAGSVVDGTVRGFRAAGTVLSAALLVVCWFRATRGSVMLLLSISLLGVIVLSPAVQPWYFLWALPCLALLSLSPTQVYWIAGVSVALTLVTRPMGSSLEASIYIPAVLASFIAGRSLLGPVVQRPRAATITPVAILEPVSR